MNVDIRAAGILMAFTLLEGCAAPPAQRSSGVMTMPLAEGQVRISDVDGPYGAARYGENAVAIRLWPDSLDDGLAEFTVIVTNNTWNTVTVSADNIQLVGHDTETGVLGKRRMLSRLAGGLNPDGSLAEAGSESIAGARAAQSTVIVESTTGARQAPIQSGAGFGAATMAAANRADSRRPALSTGDDRDDDERQEAIEAWYLDSIEVYPGETGAAGFSVPVPAADSDFEIRVMIGETTYRYPVVYRLTE